MKNYYFTDVNETVAQYFNRVVINHIRHAEKETNPSYRYASFEIDNMALSAIEVRDYCRAMGYEDAHNYKHRIITIWVK